MLRYRVLTSWLLLGLLTPLSAAGTKPIDSALDHVALRGQVPTEEYPAVQSKSDRIWSYLVERFALSARAPTPTVQFQPFDLARQSPGWSAWQKDWIRTHPAIWRDWSAVQPARLTTAISPEVPPDVSPEWINSHIDSVFPFPRNFVAFHYDGTNRIQIDPRRAFIDSMQVFIDGERRGRSGQGFYSLGHEMLHYALELRGVEQKKLHHCLMLYTERKGDTTSALTPALMPALMEEVADHLVEEQIIAPIARLRGLRTEHSLRPCNRLTDEELAQVADFRARLAPGGNSAAATAGVSDGTAN
jgi:hypothetical protein